ncbi:MAG: hypothetical protein ACRDWA_04315 [Acidimicrobiia bacterium]
MTRHVGAFRIADLPIQRLIADPRRLLGLGLGVKDIDGVVALGDEHPAIIFRYATMRGNTRTMIAACETPPPL